MILKKLRPRADLNRDRWISESRVLTVTPRGQLSCRRQKNTKQYNMSFTACGGQQEGTASHSIAAEQREHNNNNSNNNNNNNNNNSNNNKAWASVARRHMSAHSRLVSISVCVGKSRH